MDKEQKRKIRNRISIISIIMVALVAIFLFLCIKNPQMNPIYFYLVVGGFLLSYWILLDFIEPRLLHQLDDITEEQRKAYITYVLMELVGYIGIAVFVFSIGSARSNYGLIGAIAYIFTMTTKKKHREKFLGINQKEKIREETEEQEDVEETEEQEENQIEDQHNQETEE